MLGIDNSPGQNQREFQQFLRAIQRGQIGGGLLAMGKLKDLIKGGSLGAIIFYLKTKHKWNDDQKINVTFDVNKMTKEDKIRFFADLSPQEKMSMLEGLIEPTKRKRLTIQQN